MKTRILALILVLVMLLSVVSCKKDGDEDNTQESVSVDTSDGYDYGELNCQGADFTFLNYDEDTWGMKTALAPEEIKGEDVSDAVFKRNVKVQGLYNVNIKKINKPYNETATFVTTQCSSGDTTVDVAFVQAATVPTLIASKSLNDISANDEIDIYEPWWNQTIRESSQFGGSSELYYAQSEISLTAFELTWCIIANLDMMNTLKLDAPYDLVKNGEWTMEKMFELAKKGSKADSNGGGYTYNSQTNCVVGFTTYHKFTAAGVNGAGVFITDKDEMGYPEFLPQREKFIDVVEDYAEFFTTDGAGLHAQDNDKHYEQVFADQRALLAGVEIKATSKYRASEFKYGILPVPKYDEEQERYYSNVNDTAPVLVIPVTNAEHEKTGIILDTMAYLSYKEVLPVYYESNLSYKALQDMDSIDMLNIIRDSRCFEVSLLYGWTTDFYSNISSVFCGLEGKGASSVIASSQTTVKANIKNFTQSLR